jgi:hypothetical protein
MPFLSRRAAMSTPEFLPQRAAIRLLAGREMMVEGRRIASSSPA